MHFLVIKYKRMFVCFVYSNNLTAKHGGDGESPISAYVSGVEGAEPNNKHSSNNRIVRY